MLRELKEDKMSEKAVRDQTLPVSQRVDREKEVEFDVHVRRYIYLFYVSCALLQCDRDAVE